MSYNHPNGFKGVYLEGCHGAHYDQTLQLPKESHVLNEMRNIWSVTDGTQTCILPLMYEELG